MEQLYLPLAWSPDSRKIALETAQISQDVGLTETVYVASITTRRSTYFTNDTVTRNDVGLCDTDGRPQRAVALRRRE